MSSHFFESILFNKKVVYETLLEDYLDNKLNVFQFENLFLQLYNDDMENYQRFLSSIQTSGSLGKFEISSKSDGFESLISKLVGLVECMADPDLELLEPEFNSEIKKIYKKMITKN